ncbi:MAG: AraC family ligand binding domain-containing protein [Anaerolineaceae bacterium]|nr:AraC family ligand binding domain-containing protein [Anaerolineaceae bacterium]MCB9100005.1 AraC family ligand binding domain-containing protein [Anaerolineales bacterium]
MELKITPWIKEEAATADELLEQMDDYDSKVYRWSSPADYVFAGHTHGFHKLLYVVEGSIKFDFPTRHKSVTLNPGDRLELPAGVRHSAVVGASGVECLEAHVY